MSNPIVERFRTGNVPEQVKAAAARGALPIPVEDLLLVLFHLRGEKALQADIVKTIKDMQVEPLLDVASMPETEPAMLDFLARAAFQREEVVEKLVLNAATTDETMHLVALHGSPSLLELMMLNQVRLTRNPRLIQAILDNPKVTLTIRRRLKEVWDLHSSEAAARKLRDDRQAAAAAAATAETAASEAAAAEAARAAEAAGAEAKRAEDAAAAQSAPAETTGAPKVGEGADGTDEEATKADLAALVESIGGLEGLKGLEDLDDLGESVLDAAVLAEMIEQGASEEELRLAQRLPTMSVAAKVQLALKGSREARSVLIRESSKLIQEAVVKSPKITENEIETFSTMRSLSQDVLRYIAQNREYTRNYSITHNLVKNPRCPPPQAIQLMANLQARDLKSLVKDKSVSESIRRQAKLLLGKREQKK